MELIKNQKTKKILNIVVNVLVILILALALIVTIFNITSSKSGYNTMFGKAYVAVVSSSMDGDKEDSFKKGDLLTVRILKEDEKSGLEVGTILTFYDPTRVKGERVINSHRIVGVDGNGCYITKGDNEETNPVEDEYHVPYASIIGVVEGKIGGIGAIFSWFRSSTGFLVCIVVPSFLVVAYFLFKLCFEILRLKKAGVNTQKEQMKEQMKEELMAELRAQGMIAGQDGESAAPAEQQEQSSDSDKPNGNDT